MMYLTLTGAEGTPLRPGILLQYLVPATCKAARTSSGW